MAHLRQVTCLIPVCSLGARIVDRDGFYWRRAIVPIRLLTGQRPRPVRPLDSMQCGDMSPHMSRNLGSGRICRPGAIGMTLSLQSCSHALPPRAGIAAALS
jgi:hypothetical protein